MSAPAVSSAGSQSFSDIHSLQSPKSASYGEAQKKSYEKVRKLDVVTDCDFS